MSQTQLREHIEPFPGIRDFIFVPVTEGDSRTWIYSAEEDPQFILNFHFQSLLTHGWRVSQAEPSILAKKGDEGLSVSTLRRDNETRVVYQLEHADR